MSLSPTVLFIPTPMEESLLPNPLRNWLAQQGVAIQICGLGPIYAGIQASRMLAQNRVSRAILMGIAGAYDDSLAIGQASFFDRVACYGIGLGTGAAYRTPVEAGWDFGSGSVYQPLSCSVPEAWDGSTKLLLTCCASSYDAMDVRLRLAKFPEACAEDMEAYAIAVACRSTNTPFSVVRGISNYAGDRDLSHWKIQEAMRAASDLLYQFLTLDPSHD